ncbi:MAG: MFS transporter [Halobacteriaceae archaeon]
MTSTTGHRHWTVLAGCVLFGASFNAYIIAPASLVPRLVDAYAIDKPAAGLAISAVFLGWALVQMPGGILTDRYDNRALVAVAVAVFVLAGFAGGLAPSYPTLLVSRVVGGGLGAFLWTTSTNIVNRVFPADSRAIGTSIFAASAPVGVAVAQFLGPHVADVVGWQAVFVLYPLAAVLGLPILYAATEGAVRAEAQLSLGDFAVAVRNRGVLAVAVASFSAYSLFVFLNSWMPTYGIEQLGIGPALAGAASAMVPVGGIIARPGGGWLSDHLDRRRRPVVVASLLVTLPVMWALSGVSVTLAFAALLLVAGVTVQSGIGIFYVYAAELAADGTEGTALAVLTTVSTIGSLSAPVVAGFLVASVSWTAAFVFAAALALLGAGAVLLAPEPHA